MVKQYLRYEPSLTFGVIVSGDSNICYDPSGHHLLSPALDRLKLWNLKQGLAAKTYAPFAAAPHTLAITSIAAADCTNSIASGHADGSIRLWDSEKATCEATLNGHNAAVTALRYNQQTSSLASGSKDRNVILWDAVKEDGRFLLRGHMDQVTDLVFLDAGNKLVTCSKDRFVKVWDLGSQHCMQTVGGHRSEVWTLDVDSKERFLVTGSADLELRCYQIRNSPMASESKSNWEVLKHFGDIQRQGKDRVANVRFNKSGNLLACQVAGKTVEIYRVLDDVEALRKAKRRVHRKKEKGSGKAATGEGEHGSVVDPLPSQDNQQPSVIVSDVFKPLHVLRTGKKICSIAFCPNTPKVGLATLSLSLNNNMLETYMVDSDKISKLYSIELQGHRSDIRSVTLSSDNDLLMSTSHNAVKIWNPSTGACLRTVESGYGICSSFVPGNKYGLVGTKSGALEIIDVGSGSTIQVVEAHDGSINSILQIPDGNGHATGKGFVTGGTDHVVKFWEYELSQTADDRSKQLTVANNRTLTMNDQVVAVAISPTAKYVAVSLLDSTIKVHYLDTLKFALSLYGHTLPVFCMDISSDGDLIVSGSADKNLKIWGLDFGDCHKSIFAHADSVMDVKFVRNTHYMFSVGKDRLVKYWDADKFELLLTLNGHHADVWCLAISSRGDFIVTGSHDRSIRRWDRTEEPFFIEEEREKRLEEVFESDLDNFNEDRHAPKESIPEEGSVGVPGKKTKETLGATDLIIDALDIAEAEMKRIDQHKEEQKAGKASQFQPNIIMRGLSPLDYVLHTLASVNTNDLEQALLALPFSDALKLMSYLREWTNIPDKVEIVSRVTTVLLQTHHNQLTTALAAKPMLMDLKDILHERVKECKDTIGFNLAAMDHLKELLSMKSDAPFRDAKAKLMEIRLQQAKRTDKTALNDKRKKKKQKPSSRT